MNPAPSYREEFHCGRRGGVKASVIISTYKRREQALETIRAFSNQTYKDFEIIIVDQGPEYISKEDISDLGGSLFIKYCRMGDHNLPKARNTGIMNAEADIVLFFDDDILPDKSLIEKHVDNYEDKRIGGVGGRIIDISKRKRRFSLKALYPFVATFNPLDGSLFVNFDKDKRCEVRHINGCNMSFRRRLLIDAGLFDERLAGTSYTEDTDMSFRVGKLGYRLIFEPKAVVRHLGLTYGGCQTEDIHEHIYWLYFSDTVFFLRYIRRIFFVFFFAHIFVRLILYILLKQDPRIMVYAKRGFFDAFKK